MRGLSLSRKLTWVAVVVSLIPVSLTLKGATAAPVVTRYATVTTDNCNDLGGLCRANNPSQPGGNNRDFIQASMTITDNGTTVNASGFGSGFTPGRVYVSLLYLNPNAATCGRFPAGQQAQTLNTAAADNDFVSMFLGYWLVNLNGTASFVVQPGKPTPIGYPIPGGLTVFPPVGLAAYGTVSIREAAGGILAGNAQQIATNITANAAGGGDVTKGQDIPPNLFHLKACGGLRTTP